MSHGESRLVATGRSELRGDPGMRRTYAEFICSCGSVKWILPKSVKSGNTSSCGCLHREMLLARLTTHGMRDTKLYYVWVEMRKRCSSDKPRYGGRGISVCEEWGSFAVFHDWSIRNGYRPGLSIDRIDNDGNYQPDNCRWTTRVVQARNTSTNHMIAAFGETKCMAAWVDDDRCTVSYGCLKRRIRRGMNPELAIKAARIK